WINKTSIKENYSKFIMQLAMVEKGELIKKEKEKKATALWGLVETANEKLHLSCYCQSKIGFDLAEELVMEVNNNNRTINLTLPSPQVVSVEYTPSFYLEKSGGGVFHQLTNSDAKMIYDYDYNELLNSAKYEARDRANQHQNIRQAKENVKIFFQALFHPLITNPKYPYKLHIDFAPRTETCDFSCSC
ncbi:DUF4230 domain-containing protein, partial [Phaeodactylibacter luteus]